MTLQIKIKLGRMCNLAINDGSSRAVTAFICVSFVCRKESTVTFERRDTRMQDENKPNVMPLADNDDGDFGADAQFLQCLWWEIDGYSNGTQIKVNLTYF